MVEPDKCPFCGWLPVVQPLDPDVEGDAFGRVVCMNSKCATYDDIRRHGVNVSDGEQVSDDRGSDAYKQIAIARWNKRI